MFKVFKFFFKFKYRVDFYNVKMKRRSLLSGNKSDIFICCVMVMCMFFCILLVKKNFVWIDCLLNW